MHYFNVMPLHLCIFLQGEKREHGGGKAQLTCHQDKFLNGNFKRAQICNFLSRDLINLIMRTIPYCTLHKRPRTPTPANAAWVPAGPLGTLALLRAARGLQPPDAPVSTPFKSTFTPLADLLNRGQSPTSSSNRAQNRKSAGPETPLLSHLASQ